MVIRNNTFHETSFFNSSNQLTGNILNSYSQINEYFNLKKANEQLVKENAYLNTLGNLSNNEIFDHPVTINDTVYKQQYSYIPAKVINNSTNRQANYLTLNKGRENGIRANMGVASGNGIVGIVKDVSSHFCTVMSLLHKDTKISSKLKRDGSFGPLIWNENDYKYAFLTDIPTHVLIRPGDTVVTSGFTGIFPYGIMIGKVESYERKPGDYFYTVKVNLSTDFKNLYYVYIITNSLKLELDSLEKNSQND